MGEMVGPAESTACQIVTEFVPQLLKNFGLKTVEICFPEANDGFKVKLIVIDDKWQFPYAFLGTSGSHIFYYISQKQSKGNDTVLKLQNFIFTCNTQPF